MLKKLSLMLNLEGWRQADHILKQSKNLNRAINRISFKKGKDYKNRLKKEYKKLLRLARKVVERVDDQEISIIGKTQIGDPLRLAYAEVQLFSRRTQKVISTAHRRVILGERVPNSDKIFSVFEPHTQLYRRGKAGKENQFGRLFLTYFLINEIVRKMRRTSVSEFP